MFSVHKKAKKPAFSNSSGLKRFLVKLHYRDGLVWMICLAIEIKLDFQISLMQSGLLWTSVNYDVICNSFRVQRKI